MLILAVVGVATVQYNSEADESSTSPSDGGLESTSHFRTTSAIQVICSPTDYKSSCESSLSKYVNESSKPKDLVRAAVLAVVDGVSKAFNRSDSIKSDDPEVKAAIADCKEMHQYAVDELAKTLSHIDEHHLKQLPKQIPELKNWLSAVVAYQQTCIDGFPEGKLKSKMQAAMKSAKEITSNALVIVGKISSFLTLIQVAGFSRRLLEEEPAEPAWASHGDRRLLQTSATPQFTPNVTVAKDGSGDFTTISGALAKAPKKLLHGRYVIYVKEGVYEETVEVDKNTWNITMYGDGEQKTIVTGSKNFIDGVKTYHTATFGHPVRPQPPSVLPRLPHQRHHRLHLRRRLRRLPTLHSDRAPTPQQPAEHRARPGPQRPPRVHRIRHPQLPYRRHPRPRRCQTQVPQLPRPPVAGVLQHRHHGVGDRRLHRARRVHAMGGKFRAGHLVLRRVQQQGPRRRHLEAGQLGRLQGHQPGGGQCLHCCTVHTGRRLDLEDGRTCSLGSLQRVIHGTRSYLIYPCPSLYRVISI
ncbi:pectinesterase [Musa troglodytarum]|uniref:Pectinesterase n=1 Tax=Musa troglodytarum TaxID=320322 RepID=A0A9E7KW52_9LILI|nr:pectinesterase [Musa troglodytarum]